MNIPLLQHWAQDLLKNVLGIKLAVWHLHLNEGQSFLYVMSSLTPIFPLLFRGCGVMSDNALKDLDVDEMGFVFKLC